MRIHSFFSAALVAAGLLCGLNCGVARAEPKHLMLRGPIASNDAIKGSVGVPLHFALQFSDVSLATTREFSIADGTLPAGLTLDVFSGVISGTPTAATASGGATVGINIHETGAPSGYDTTAGFNVTFYIGTDPGNLAPFGYAGIARGYLGSPFSHSLQSHDLEGDPVTYSLVTPLPPGLSLDGKTGLITGTPTRINTVDDEQTTVFNVTDGQGRSTSGLFVFVIEEARSLVVTTETETADPEVGYLDGKTSLNEALQYAKDLQGSNPVVTFDLPVGHRTLQLKAGGLYIRYGVTIEGPTQGGGVTFVAFPGNFAMDLEHPQGDVSLKNLNFNTGGDTTAFADVANNGGNLTLTNCTFTGVTAQTGVALSINCPNQGYTHINNCTFNMNGGRDHGAIAMNGPVPWIPAPSRVMAAVWAREFPLFRVITPPFTSRTPS